MDGRCAQVDVDAGDVDVVSGAAWAAGATGVQELDLGDGRVRLIIGLASFDEAAVLRTLADRGVVDVFDADYDGWLDAWRPFARPVRVGSLVVRPPWESVSDDGSVIVAIDPGRAFGQGAHPTTRLMLEALQAIDLRGRELLDVGCGSGVLAVTAAVLGAERVVAVDIDPEAVRVTRDNAQRNDVRARVEVAATPVVDVAGTFDLVLANILAPVLVDLAPAIRSRIAVGGKTAGGRLLLSGMLSEQRDMVLDAYAPMRVVDEQADADWWLLELGW